eukprot:3936617-Rhodomonas_salina.1
MHVWRWRLWQKAVAVVVGRGGWRVGSDESVVSGPIKNKSRMMDKVKQLPPWCPPAPLSRFQSSSCTCAQRTPLIPPCYNLSSLDPPSHSPLHSRTHSLHSLTYPPTHPRNHALAHALTYSLARALARCR